MRPEPGGADCISATSVSSDNINSLASRPVGRLLWQYSMPAVVGMLVMALYNVVDRIFIGQVVGAEAIAGMALTFPLMNITTAIGVIVGVGSSARISILLGRHNSSQAALILGNAATLTVVNGIIYIAAFATFMKPVLHLFGAGPFTLPYAYEYMMWVLPGLLLTNVAFSFNNVLRATGYPVDSMLTMIIGAVVNVILDAVFVLWLGWGMKGAALATDIAMAASAFFVMRHLLFKNRVLTFRRHTFGLRRDVVASIISLGAAPSIINVASCLVNALINRSLVAIGGDMAIGAAGVFVTVTSLVVTVVLGISMGFQPIAGFNYGSGNFSRVRRVFVLATAAGTAICILGWAAGLTFPHLIGRAFTSDPSLISSTVVCLRHAMWAFPVVGIQIISTTLFQSIGAPGRALILSLARQVVFLIPLILWLPVRLGVEGVWLSFPLSDLLATVVTLALIIPAFRRMKAAAKTT